MCGECNWPLENKVTPVNQSMETNKYRYCCPNCNRTWLDNEKGKQYFCWHCGQKAICVQDSK